MKELDKQSFQVRPTIQNGFSVAPIAPASPQATRNNFKQSPIVKVPVKRQDTAVVKPVTNNAAVDLTLDSTDDEVETVPIKKSSFISAIFDRVKKIAATLPMTRKFDELTGEKDAKIKAWIKTDKSRSRDVIGGVLPVSEDLPTLLPDAKRLVEYHWAVSDRDSIVSEVGDIQLTHGDLRRFIGREWLNDECINGYLQLIQANHPEIHVFNTFFYLNLSRRGYESVQRWTRRIDLFNKTLVLIPVHLGMHWTMACIDLSQKEIIYLDSFHAGNNQCLNSLWSYMEQEHMNKKGCAWDSFGWKAHAETDGVPKQLNGFDCGVFTCVFGEFLARRSPFNFSQSDMPYFRYKLSYELITKQFLI